MLCCAEFWRQLLPADLGGRGSVGSAPRIPGSEIHGSTAGSGGAGGFAVTVDTVDCGNGWFMVDKCVLRISLEFANYWWAEWVTKPHTFGGLGSCYAKLVACMKPLSNHPGPFVPFKTQSADDLKILSHSKRWGSPVSSLETRSDPYILPDFLTNRGFFVDPLKKSTRLGGVAAATSHGNDLKDRDPAKTWRYDAFFSWEQSQKRFF